MDSEKIGKFIRKLREDNGMSQYDLADKIPIDRSVISKWERGEASPPTDKLLILCEIFNIGIEELISGELKTKENEKEHERNLFNFLLKQDSKYKRIKMVSVILFISILVLCFSFLIYYFLETHNTEKIYRIHGSSENYELNNGLLVITREKSYLKLGFINNKNNISEMPYEIEFYYKDKDGNINIIYNGNSDIILSDRYGYDASLNNFNYEDIKNELYIKINNEEIKLELSDEYFNDNYTLDDWNIVKNDVSTDSNLSIDMDKIKNDFECNEILCEKEMKNEKLRYLIDTKVFQINFERYTLEYNVDGVTLVYLGENEKFKINKSNLICEVGPCNNYKEIYDKYYTNLIKNYLK